MGASPLPLSWGKKNNEEGVWNLFSNSVTLSDAVTVLGFSTGESWVLGNACPAWRAGSRPVRARICVPSARLWDRSTHTQPEGWIQSFPGHLQADRGSVHTQAGLAVSADSEGCSKAEWIYPQRGQNYNQGAPRASSLSWFPSKPSTNRELNCGISALLSHSWAGKSDSLWHYTRADCSAAAFLPDSAEAHHTEQLLSPQGTSCRGLNSNTLVPKLHEEGCKLLILQ